VRQRGQQVQPLLGQGTRGCWGEQGARACGLPCSALQQPAGTSDRPSRPTQAVGAVCGGRGACSAQRLRRPASRQGGGGGVDCRVAGRSGGWRPAGAWCARTAGGAGRGALQLQLQLRRGPPGTVRRPPRRGAER
jgi:hypothetical protein